MAVQLILVQFVEVRILVGQQVTSKLRFEVLFFWERGELARQSGHENKTSPAPAGRGHLGNAERRWINGGRGGGRR